MTDEVQTVPEVDQRYDPRRGPFSADLTVGSAGVGRAGR
jgi:hypothetical protein